MEVNKGGHGQALDQCWQCAKSVVVVDYDEWHDRRKLVGVFSQYLWAERGTRRTVWELQSSSALLDLPSRHLGSDGLSVELVKSGRSGYKILRIHSIGLLKSETF